MAQTKRRPKRSSVKQCGSEVTHIEMPLGEKVSSKHVADILRQCLEDNPIAELSQHGIRPKVKPLSNKILVILSHPISSKRLVDTVRNRLQMIIDDAVAQIKLEATQQSAIQATA